jgi:hypothetical protein
MGSEGAAKSLFSLLVAMLLLEGRTERVEIGAERLKILLRGGAAKRYGPAEEPFRLAELTLARGDETELVEALRDIGARGGEMALADGERFFFERLGRWQVPKTSLGDPEVEEGLGREEVFRWQ